MQDLGVPVAGPQVAHDHAPALIRCGYRPAGADHGLRHGGEDRFGGLDTAGQVAPLPDRDNRWRFLAAKVDHQRAARRERAAFRPLAWPRRLAGNALEHVRALNLGNRAQQPGRIGVSGSIEDDLGGPEFNHPARVHDPD